MARALDVDGIHDDDVRSAARELDRQVIAFRTRAIPRAFPYLIVDAVPQRVRVNGRLTTMAAIIVAGISTTGAREILAVEASIPDDRAFAALLLAGLRDRGVYGVRLITSDPFPGLEAAIRHIFPAASWQRSRSGFVRDVVAAAPGSRRAELRRALGNVFAHDDRKAALTALRQMGAGTTEVDAMLRQAADEEAVLAYFDVPAPHRQRVCATTCLAKAHRELDRHCRLIGIFPSQHALLRLAGVMMEEHNDEWVTGPRYFGRRTQQALITTLADSVDRSRVTADGRPVFRLVQAR